MKDLLSYYLNCRINGPFCSKHVSFESEIDGTR